MSNALHTFSVHLPITSLTDPLDFRAWFAGGPAMVTAVSPGGVVVFASEAAVRALGRCGEDVECTALASLYHPEDRASLRAALDEALRAPGTDVRRELRRIRADGAELWVDETLRAISSGGGPVVLVHTQDATERRSAGEALEQSASLLAAALESTADGILVADLEGRVTLWNQRFVEMWGIPEEVLRAGDGYQVLALAAAQVIDPEAHATAARALLEGAEGEAARLIRLADGRFFERVSKPQCLGGRVVGRVWSYSDVTEAKRTEAVLRESEERYALAIEGALEGIWDWDLEREHIYLSPRWKAILGYGPDETVGEHPDEWLTRVHPDDLRRVQGELAASIGGGRTHFEIEHRVMHRDGSWRWTRARAVTVFAPDGRPVRIAGSLSDITEQKVAEELLLHHALHDVLTGLPNRSLLIDRLNIALRRTARSGGSVGVLFMDLDGFKVVNDSLGHATGDRLLDAVARRLEGCLRPSDTVARMGGDEFTVLLEDLRDAAEARAVAERVHEALREAFVLDGRPVFTTASVGIAVGAAGATPESLLRDADTAMYRAKSQGRARCEVFDPTMHTTALARLQLETDLRGAVERDEFELAYQPLVLLADGRVAGFEALVRWRHPERGLLQPSEFITVAEETGVIVPLGRWVLREACRQMRAWNDRYGVTLSVNVNLSPRQFLDGGLAREVAAALGDTKLPAGLLKLEITEGLLMGDAGPVATTLDDLKALGVELCIDDFGTGYSSLSYLHRFPIDTLKIDRSFVSRLSADGGSDQIVRTILVLAQTLNMRAVAEGVETAEQADQLRAMGCEFAQGFRFSRPLPGEDAGAMIWRQRLTG
ncbi:MAG TPA: EAL domain-containing protein [Longimicrobium sp.]|nr:EAL domain-containing protein [Longimicrobium sp.]